MAILLSLLVGCAAGAPTAAGEAEPSPAEAPALLDHEQATGMAAELDTDLLFHVLAAERLGAVGELDQALGHYLAASRLDSDPELARQVVRLAMRLGDWPTLVEGARRWSELLPGDRAALQFEVLGLINGAETDAAAARLAALMDQSRPDPLSWREAMQLVGAADEPDLARATLDQLLGRLGEGADTHQALYSRSLLLWQLGDGPQALALAVAAADAGGGRQARLWAAQLAMNLDELELALAQYQGLRREEPDDIGLGLAEAEVLTALGREQEAMALLASLPPDTEVLYLLGTYHFQADDIDAGAAVWRRLAELVPEPDDNDQHAFLTGFLAELLELDDEALQWYTRVEGGPNVERARIRRALIEGRRGNLMTARGLLRSVRLGPDLGLREQAWVIEADLLRESDQAGEAVELLTGALREQPDSVMLLYSRAICAVAIDDIELAEQDLRRILQIEDDNAMALNALGYTLTDRTDRHREAYRLIRRALELEPDSPAILDSMGWVYFRLGQPEQALPYLERALAGEDNPEIAAHVGEVLWTLGREAEARELLERARRDYPDDRYLLDTLQRLGLLE